MREESGCGRCKGRVGKREGGYEGGAGVLREESGCGRCKGRVGKREGG